MGQDEPMTEPDKTAGAAEAALLDDLPVVQAATLHQQTLQEAPADVTVITAAEIRKYGYRTLGEALASARGFYSSYDRIYHYVGVSGFSLPGDFNTRFLVMINGHAMTEHVYDSNGFFGQDFGLDMDLVERIEIIRGSASALYGSNAMLATINVITRSPVDATGFRASTETGSFGEKKAFVSESVYLGKGVNLLAAGSFFSNGGQSLFIPEFDSPATNNGVATHSDGEQGFHAFVNLIWHDWSFTALIENRLKRVPVNWADNTVFDDGGSRVRDSRNFLEAARSQDVGTNGKLHYRIYFDDYRYDDRFDYDFGYIDDQRSLARADWIGSEITYTRPDSDRGELTIGTQGEWDLRNRQEEYSVTPIQSTMVNLSVPDRTIAVFAQQEWRFWSRLKVYGGLRLDHSHNYGSALSPRVALVYQASPLTVFKLAYGSPFRHPSAFEKYFSDNETLVSNLNLQAERANTFELSAEHKFARQLSAIISLYQYRVHGLIEEVFPDVGIPQYQNVDSARSTGVEFEVSKHLPGEVELLGSATFQRTADAATQGSLANAPDNLLKLRAGLPLLRRRIFAASAVQYLSSRSTIAGATLPGVFLQDLTLTSRQSIFSAFAVQVGIRNLWNKAYEAPVGLSVDTMQQDGRSIYVKLSWRGSE